MQVIETCMHEGEVSFFLTHAILQKWVVLQWSPETLKLSRNNAFLPFLGQMAIKCILLLLLLPLKILFNPAIIGYLFLT